MQTASIRIAAASLALVTLLSAGTAHATGVAAGSLIKNTASASYDTGGATSSVDSNTVTVTVDEVLDVAVVSQDAAPVPVSSSASVLEFLVTNTGNGPEAYKLTTNPIVTGNQFTATVVGIAIDTNKNGTYDEGIDQILGAAEASPSIAADKALTVFVLVQSGNAPNGQTSQVNLLAQAVTGTGSPGTAFMGKGQGGGDAVVGATGADDDDNGALIARLATVSLAKTATVLDQYGGSQAIPGATITYSLVATIGGSGTIDDLRISDIIPANTAYKLSSLTLDGTILSDAEDADAGKGSAAGIDVLIGTSSGGSTHTVTFAVTVNSGD